MIISDYHLRLFQLLVAVIFVCAGFIQLIEDVMFTIDARILFPLFQTYHWVSVILDYCFSVTTICSGLIGIISVLIPDVTLPKTKLFTFIVWVISLFVSFGLALANAGIVIYLIVLVYDPNSTEVQSFHFSFIFSLVYQGLFSILCVVVLIIVVFLEIPLVWSTYRRNQKTDYQSPNDDLMNQGHQLMSDDEDN